MVTSEEGDFQVVVRVVDDVHRVAGACIAARHRHVVVLVGHVFVLGSPWAVPSPLASMVMLPAPMS